MVELITTAIVTAGSALLFGYWIRCAMVLLRGQYAPTEALPTPAREEVLLHPANARLS